MKRKKKVEKVKTKAKKKKLLPEVEEESEEEQEEPEQTPQTAPKVHAPCPNRYIARDALRRKIVTHAHYHSTNQGCYQPKKQL
jgi:hypothetical protein